MRCRHEQEVRQTASLWDRLTVLVLPSPTTQQALISNNIIYLGAHLARQTDGSETSSTTRSFLLAENSPVRRYVELPRRWNSAGLYIAYSAPPCSPPRTRTVALMFGTRRRKLRRSWEQCCASPESRTTTTRRGEKSAPPVCHFSSLSLVGWTLLAMLRAPCCCVTTPDPAVASRYTTALEIAINKWTKCHLTAPTSCLGFPVDVASHLASGHRNCAKGSRALVPAIYGPIFLRSTSQYFREGGGMPGRGRARYATGCLDSHLAWSYETCLDGRLAWKVLPGRCSGA